MDPDHDERFRRIVDIYLERPGGDYGELLRRGHVTSTSGVDPEQWRAEIRRQARHDKLRVKTSRHGDHAFAVLEPTLGTAQEDELLRSEFARVAVLRELAGTAQKLGHELGRWLRHHDETIAMCARCDARIYVRVGDDPVSAGEALTDPCSDRPPG